MKFFCTAAGFLPVPAFSALHWTGRGRRPVVVCNLDAHRHTPGSSDEEKRWNLLATYYGTVGKLFRKRRSTKAFEKMDRLIVEGFVADVEIFNRLLDTCARARLVGAAERLIGLMEKLDQPPDGDSYAAMVRLYYRMNSFKKIDTLYEQLTQGNLPDSVDLYNALLQSCSSAKDVGKAEDIVRTMGRNRVSPDLFTYETMAKLYFLVGDAKRLVQLLNGCVKGGLEPSALLCSRVIEGLSSFGDIQIAETVFSRARAMELELHPDCLAALTRRYAQDGNEERLEQLFTLAEKERIVSYTIFFESCFRGLCEWRRLDLAKRWIRVMTMKELKPNSHIGRSLLKLRAMSTESTSEVLKLMGSLEVEGVARDSVLYDGFIVALAYCSASDEIEQAFKEMFEAGITPTPKAYSEALIAHASNGRVAAVRSVLRWMRRDNLSPSVAACESAIVLFAENNSLADLEPLLEHVRSRKFELNTVVWQTVKSAYGRIRGQADTGNLENHVHI